MKLKPLLIVVLVSVWSVVSTDTSVDNGLEEKQTCYQSCGKTYSLHTYPKSQHLNACKRGCRLQILSHVNLVQDSAVKFDPKVVTIKCLNSCAEIYDSKTNSSEYYACSIGCNYTANSDTASDVSAVDADNNRSKVLPNDKYGEQDTSDAIIDDNNSNQLFISPLHLLRSLFSSLVNRRSGGSVVVERHSMSVYLSRNSDGESKLVVVQSEPEVVVHQYPDLIQMNEYDSETVTGSEERTDITTDNTRPKLDLSIWTQENPLEVNNANRIESSKSWSNCFNYQSGVPRWVLASILFLAVIVLASICCTSTAVTTPEQHIRRKVGQGSDLKYLCLYEEPIKIVIDDKLPTYEELESQMTQKSCNNSNNENKESILK